MRDAFPRGTTPVWLVRMARLKPIFHSTIFFLIRFFSTCDVPLSLTLSLFLSLSLSLSLSLFLSLSPYSQVGKASVDLASLRPFVVQPLRLKLSNGGHVTLQMQYVYFFHLKVIPA